MARTKHPAVRMAGRPPKKKLQFERSPSQRAAQTGRASTSETQGRGAPAQDGAAAAGCGIGEAGAVGRIKKPHRWRPGMVTLREIRKFQKSTNLVIPCAPFIRLVREITNDYSKEVTRWTPEALLHMQEAAEFHLMELFEV